MNQVLVVIVNKGENKNVIQLANDAGAQGATVLRGKGASIFEKKGFLGLDIVADKDVVFIVSQKSNIEKIMESLNKEFKFNEPNSGIAFVLNANRAIGLVNDG